MKELEQLISLTDGWIKEACDKAQHIRSERSRCKRGWNVRIAFAAVPFVGFFLAALIAHDLILLIPSLLFSFAAVQAIYYRYDCGRDWDELEALCQERIDNLINDRESFRRMQKELNGY